MVPFISTIYIMSRTLTICNTLQLSSCPLSPFVCFFQGKKENKIFWWLICHQHVCIVNQFVLFHEHRSSYSFLKYLRTISCQAVLSHLTTMKILQIEFGVKGVQWKSSVCGMSICLVCTLNDFCCQVLPHFQEQPQELVVGYEMYTVQAEELMCRLGQLDTALEILIFLVGFMPTVQNKPFLHMVCFTCLAWPFLPAHHDLYNVHYACLCKKKIEGRAYCVKVL